MNAFESVAATLSKLGTRPRIDPPAGHPDEVVSRTEQIRRLLAAQGPLTGANIATQLEFERTELVGALLKNDIRKGRVEHVGGRYRLVDDWDEHLQSELRDAAALLRRNGYTVTRGTVQ